MLFLPERIQKARLRLLQDIDNGMVSAEFAFGAVLDLIPEDTIGLAGFADVYRESNPTKAVELLWRVVELQPCDFPAFIRLANFLYSQPEGAAMAEAVAELAFRKMLLYAEVKLELVKETEIPGMDHAPSPSGANAYEKVESFLASREGAPQEAAEVTTRLVPFRLIQKMQESEDLERAHVDEILQAGTVVVPALVGVLRGWAQGFLDEEEDANLVENAIGLLGELGTADELYPLLEYATIEADNLSGAAKWAVDRILRRLPEQSERGLVQLAPKLGARERIVVLEKLLTLPWLDGNGTLLIALSEAIGTLPREDLSAFVPMYLTALMVKLGRDGAELARSILRRHAGLLSNRARRDCDHIVEDFARNAPAPIPEEEPSTITVYDICAGEAEYESDNEDEEDDGLIEPRHRENLPERNDPCWCGSGKKYKKCHLDSDQASK